MYSSNKSTQDNATTEKKSQQNFPKDEVVEADISVLDSMTQEAKCVKSIVLTFTEPMIH